MCHPVHEWECKVCMNRLCSNSEPSSTTVSQLLLQPLLLTSRCIPHQTLNLRACTTVHDSSLSAIVLALPHFYSSILKRGGIRSTVTQVFVVTANRGMQCTSIHAMLWDCNLLSSSELTTIVRHSFGKTQKQETLRRTS